MNEKQKRYILDKCLNLIRATFEDNMQISDKEWEDIVDEVQRVYEKTKCNDICGKLLAETACYIDRMQKLMEKSDV